jgi:hypothetical protein
MRPLYWIAALALLAASPTGAQAPATAQASAPAETPEWLALHNQAKAEFSKANSAFMGQLNAYMAREGPEPNGKALYKDALALGRKAERAAAKATGEGSVDHLVTLDSLALYLGGAKDPGGQLATAQRALALRTRDVPKTDVRYAMALLRLASTTDRGDPRQGPLATQALADAKAILNAFPPPMTRAEAEAWRQFSDATRTQMGEMGDILYGYQTAFSYWAGRRPATGEAVDRAFREAIPLFSYLGSNDPRRSLKMHQVLMTMMELDPRPDSPFLGWELYNYGMAYKAAGDTALAEITLGRAVAELGKASSRKSPNLLQQASAELASLQKLNLERRVTQRQERVTRNLAEAQRKDAIVATPGLSSLLAALEKQGVKVGQGTR